MQQSSRSIVLRLVAACLAAVVAHARAQAISVPSTYTGLLGNSSPTLTFFWKGSEPKAVLLFITGGYGQIGLSWTPPSARASSPRCSSA